LLPIVKPAGPKKAVRTLYSGQQKANGRVEFAAKEQKSKRDGEGSGGYSLCTEKSYFARKDARLQKNRSSSRRHNKQ
jgi:hypothetical protein